MDLKTMYFPVCTQHIWFWLLCYPVILPKIILSLISLNNWEPCHGHGDAFEPKHAPLTDELLKLKVKSSDNYCCIQCVSYEAYCRYFAHGSVSGFYRLQFLNYRKTVFGRGVVTRSVGVLHFLSRIFPADGAGSSTTVRSCPMSLDPMPNTLLIAH